LSTTRHPGSARNVMAICSSGLDTLRTLCYIVGVSRITDQLAHRARQLADDIWDEAKSFEGRERDTEQSLKRISGAIHDAAGRLEHFDLGTMRKVHDS
jgi:hypothetical protein